MKIAILGFGNVGQKLAGLFEKAGNEVWFFRNSGGTPRYGGELEWKLFSQTE